MNKKLQDAINVLNGRLSDFPGYDIRIFTSLDRTGEVVINWELWRASDWWYSDTGHVSVEEALIDIANKLTTWKEAQP